MREIKFRGKRIDNNEWIYGNYVELNGIHFIIPKDSAETPSIQYEIIPETVGQFTGLTDKNGKEIYEGDIVNAEYYNHNMKNCKLRQVVCFERGMFVFKTFNLDTEEMECTYHYSPLYMNQAPNNFEVIGNIHDNKKLIKNK